MTEAYEQAEQIKFLESCVEGLRETYDELISLHSESLELQSINIEKHIWEKFLRVSDKIIQYDSAVIYFFQKGKWVRVNDTGNILPKYIKSINDSFSDGTVDWAIELSRVFCFFPDEDNLKETAVIVPLINDYSEETNAVVFFFVNRELNQRDQELLQFWSSQGVVSLENSRLYAGIKEKNLVLEKINHFIENILKTIDDGIITLDKDGKITHFSRQAEKMLCISSLIVKGFHYSKVIKGELKDIIQNIINLLAENPRVHQKEYEITIKDEKSLWVGVTGLRLTDSQNLQTGKMIVLRDLSEKREIVELKKINRMKDEFVSNVSHELRTPLTSIRAYSEILLGNIEEGYEDPEASKEFLGIIKEESERLSRLISDLLDVAKLESGKMTMSMQSLNLREVVVNSMNVIRSFAESNGQKLEMDFDTLGEYTIIGDRDKLQQVMMNILNNSVKYSNKEGLIKVTLENRDGVLLIIKDSGIGMTIEQAEKIFEKFYRVDSSLTYEISGTGLGLSIVKHIVDAHNGKIWVESEPGKGSSFFIHFKKNLDEETK